MNTNSEQVSSKLVVVLTGIIHRGGFQYPQTMHPARDWRRQNNNGTWTPESSRKMADRIVYYAQTGKHLL